jgi:DNA repair photolyase
MNLEVKEIQAKSILTPQAVGSLAAGYDYSLNPYAGCAFRCSYCYVPKFPGSHQPSEWGSWVNVKVNAPELLRRDRQKIFGSRIFFSSATDPYQYLELKYKLSQRCLEELLRYQPKKVTMHTRSHLILRDIELLKSFGSRLQVGVSITTNRDDIRAEFEPSAPSIPRRLQLIRTLKDHGIRVYASIAPLLPCYPEELASMLSDHVDKVWIDQMHWMEVNTRPQLLEKYEEFFQTNNYNNAVKALQESFKLGRASKSQ